MEKQFNIFETKFKIGKAKTKQKMLDIVWHLSTTNQIDKKVFQEINIHIDALVAQLDRASAF